MAVKLLGDLSASGNATFNSEVNLPSGGQIDWANGDARIIEGQVTNYSLSLQTYTGSALTTKMFIASGGNVGIGTTSPNQLLHVNGNLRIGPYYSDNDRDGFLFTPGGVLNTIQANNENTNFDNNQGNIHIRTGNNSSASPTERISVLSTGNVGIGTTAPLEKLHVVGKINSSNNIVSNSTYTMFTGRSSRTVDDYGGLNKQYFKANLVTPGPNTTGESSAHGIADLRFQLANSAGNTGMSDIMTLRSGGNVGIGTTTPGYKLDVSGSFGAKDGSSAIAFNEYSDGATIWLDGSNGDFAGGDYFNISAYGTTDLAFGYGASTKITMKSDGKLGVGTASPAQKLHVVGSQVRLDTAAGGYYLHNASGTFRGAFHDNGTVTSIYADGNGSTPAISIESGNSTFAGDVTAGALTSGATAQLVVNHEGGASAVAKFMSRTNRAFVQIGDNDTNGYLVAEGTNFAIGRVATVAGNSIVIDANHNATFAGKIVPSAHIELPYGGELRTLDSGGTVRTIARASSNKLQYGWSYAGAVEFMGGGSYTPRITINTDGSTTFAGDVTTGGDINVPEYVVHDGDTNTHIRFTADRIRLVAGGTTKFDSNSTYVVDSAPAAPTNLSLSVVNDTVNVTFTASATSGIDSYFVFSSVAGGDYSLISMIAPDDFGATMSIIDNAFDATGTQAYRVYAIKNGIISADLTGSISYSVTSPLEPTNMSVVNLNTAFYVQWDAPSANARFVTAYNVYKHEHATESSLARSSATLIYSGNNYSYMYPISGNDNNNFHKFWVETTVV